MRAACDSIADDLQHFSTQTSEAPLQTDATLCATPTCFAWLRDRLFHERRLDGQPVSTHGQLVKFLVNKAPAAQVTRLPFEGQNTCVYYQSR